MFAQMGAHIETLDQQVAAVDDELAAAQGQPGQPVAGHDPRRRSARHDHHGPDGRARILYPRLTLRRLAGPDTERTFHQRERMGKISKGGNERIRLLLFVGAMSVIRFAKPGSKSASA